MTNKAGVWIDHRRAVVETEDKMSNRQIVAKVRSYFGEQAPRVQPPQRK